MTFRLTDEITLRPWAPEDREAFLELFGDKAVARYMGDGVVDPDRNLELWGKLEVLETGPETKFAFILSVDRSGDVIGHIELKRTENTGDGEWEVVYMLAQSAWGQGLGTRLVRWALETTHEHGRRMMATVAPENVASRRILERAGLIVTSSLEDETLVMREPD